VIYTQTRALSGQPYATDVHGWEIHPEVAPRTDECIVFKVGPSGFENPELENILTKLDVGSVIVCGIWSEGCVAFTCESALELGYDVYLAADAHGTVRNSDTEAAIVIAEQNDKLGQSNILVLKTRDIEAHLGRG
jgi:nicotinamidase-related amidase